MFSHMVVLSTEVHDKNKNIKGNRELCQNTFAFSENFWHYITYISYLCSLCALFMWRQPYII
jgi:hypothetical protein